MKKLLTLFLIAVSLPAFSANITFNVKLSGQDLPHKDTVFIVGDITGWAFQPMFDLGDSLYTWSIDDTTTVPDTMAYYFITINSWDSAGNEDWNYYKKFREWFDTTCVQTFPLMYGSDRWIVVPTNDTTIMCYFAKCPNYVPTGINQKEVNAFHFSAYPNPTGGDVTVRLPELKGSMQIDLIDITGKVLHVNKSLISTTEIRMQTGLLPKGIYFIKVYNQEFTETRKLIIN